MTALTDDNDAKLTRVQLITKHMNVAYKAAASVYRKSNGNTSLDELKSEALLALVMAADTFDAGRSSNFGAYAYSIARFKLLDFIRSKSCVMVGSRNISAPVVSIHGRETNNGEQPMDMDIPDESMSPSTVTTSIDLERAIGYLNSERDRSLIQLMFFNDCPREEAARRLGISPGRVSQLIKAALAKVRDILTSRVQMGAGRLKNGSGEDGAKRLRTQTRAKPDQMRAEAALDAPITCRLCKGRMVKYGFTRGTALRRPRQRYRCESCNVTSVGKRREFYISDEQILAVVRCWKDMQSIRQTVETCQLARGTVQRLFARLEAVHGIRICFCGETAKHKGWCRWRYGNSPERQKVMARMHGR